MPDHSCCVTPLFQSLNCVGIPGKSQPVSIFGTGPYCCPKGATEEKPCPAESDADSLPAVAVVAPSQAVATSAEMLPSVEGARANDEPCCKSCTAPLVKYFSTDAPHGFCGESCMDPTKFDIYKKFEANLTLAKDNTPCSEQYTPSNTKKYSQYFSTVTHGDPLHILSATLDLYAPEGMPDHSCCVTPLFQSLNCVGIPGKSQALSIFGTGPYCCPKGATEEKPCPASNDELVVV